MSQITLSIELSWNVTSPSQTNNQVIDAGNLPSEQFYSSRQKSLKTTCKWDISTPLSNVLGVSEQICP